VRPQPNQALGFSKRVRISHFCHRGDRHDALDAPQGLEGLDHGSQAPGFPLLVEGLFKTL